MANEAPGREEEPTFRVTDRRRVGHEESGEPSPAAEPSGAAESEQPGEPGAGAPDEDIRLLPVADLVRVFIAELHARAWMNMGLMVNPATNLVAMDLPQARLAIDCIASLVEPLSSLLPEVERDELERMLAELQINFVRQSGA